MNEKNKKHRSNNSIHRPNASFKQNKTKKINKTKRNGSQFLQLCWAMQRIQWIYGEFAQIIRIDVIDCTCNFTNLMRQWHIFFYDQGHSSDSRTHLNSFSSDCCFDCHFRLSVYSQKSRKFPRNLVFKVKQFHWKAIQVKFNRL